VLEVKHYAFPALFVTTGRELKPSPAMVGVFSKRISDKVPLGKTKGIL
jgi:hypothetical protein